MATTKTTEEGRLEFKHGHLAGQTGLAFAFGMGEAGEGHTTTVVHLLTGGADCLACVRTSESSFKDAETEINDHEDAKAVEDRNEKYKALLSLKIQSEKFSEAAAQTLDNAFKDKEVQESSKEAHSCGTQANAVEPSRLSTQNNTKERLNTNIMGNPSYHGC